MASGYGCAVWCAYSATGVRRSSVIIIATSSEYKEPCYMSILTLILTHRGIIAGPNFANIKVKETGLMRAEEVTLSKIRSGSCTLIGIGHAFASTGEMTSQLCRWCRQHEENIPHLPDGECPDPRVTQCTEQHMRLYTPTSFNNPTSQHTHPLHSTLFED